MAPAWGTGPSIRPRVYDPGGHSRDFAKKSRFDGVLDEVRLERATRSAEWIRVQHDSMRDALLDYGPIESWESGP